MALSRSRFSSSRLARRRRKTLIQKTAFLGVMALLIAAGAVWLSRAEEVTLSKVVVTGTSSATAQALETFIRGELSGKYWHLFPKANALLFPRSSTEAAALSAFPRLSSVELRLKDFDFLQVAVIERSPAALWCGREEKEPDCYYLDQEGFLFEKAPLFEGNVFIRVYGGNPETPEATGDHILTPGQFKELYSFVISLRDLGLAPVAAALGSEGDYTITLQGGAKMLMGADQDVAEVRENLEALLSSDEFKNGKLDRLDYLDLRFGNKVYLKEKE